MQRIRATLSRLIQASGWNGTPVWKPLTRITTYADATGHQRIHSECLAKLVYRNFIHLTYAPPHLTKCLNSHRDQLPIVQDVLVEKARSEMVEMCFGGSVAVAGATFIVSLASKDLFGLSFAVMGSYIMKTLVADMIFCWGNAKAAKMGAAYVSHIIDRADLEKLSVQNRDVSMNAITAPTNTNAKK